MIYLISILFLNIVFSIGVFELILKVQNSIESVFFVWLVRKFILVVFWGLMFLLFKSIGADFVGVSEAWQGNGVILYLLIILLYLFRFFFPRQKYFDKKSGKWVVGFRKID